MRSIIQSLTITMVVGTVVGAAISISFNQPILNMIILCVLGQFIFFAVYNNYNRIKSEQFAEKEYTKRLAEASRQTVTVQCANCDEPHDHFIQIAENNEFTCESCGAKNSLYINITTAQKTTPVRAEGLQVKTLIQNELDARAQFQ